MANKTVSVAMRTDPETAERLDRIAAWLAKRAPGVEAKRSYAFRACLLAGLPLVEAQMAADQGEQAAKPSRPSKS